MGDRSKSEKPLLSFGFKKSFSTKKLNENKFSEEKRVEPERKDFILSVEERNIHSTLGNKEPKELVIPLELRKKWRVPQQVAGEKTHIDSQDESLEANAAREIIQEMAGKEPNSKESTMTIPVFIEDRVPDGYETKDKLDVSLRAEESTLDDYERIPIEEYGLAMLRGMGWKKGDPIGNTNKQVVELIEPSLRPKGLGLGADPSAAEKQLKALDEDDNKSMAKGAFVRIQDGTYKGYYGEIEGLDDEGNRLYIKLAIGGKTVTVVKFLVQSVSRSEYRDKGKLLNEKTYSERKSRYEEKEAESRHSSGSRSDSEERSHKKSSSSSRHKHSKKHSKHKRKRDDSDHEDDRRSPKQSKHQLWVRPQIKVRFINKKYKDGRYFNTKVVIIDVLDVAAETCAVRTEDGKLLDDIPASWLETVIPRNSPLNVMIVKGKYAGKLGTMLDKDKSKCKATVQLLNDKDVAVVTDFDSICEYVGDPYDHM